MPGSVHRVQRVVFDLSCRDQTAAFRARRRLNGAFADSLGGVLGEVFDGHSPNGSPYRIRHLEIDLGTLDLDRMDDDEIRNLLLSKLRRRFFELGPAEVEPEAPGARAIDAFVHFLQTGRFHWDAQERNLSELEKAILEMGETDHKRLGERLVALFADPASRRRFGYQFGRAFFLWILDLIHPDAPNLVEHCVRENAGDLRVPRWRIEMLTAVISALPGSHDHFEERIESRFRMVRPESFDGEMPEEEETKDDSRTVSDVGYTRTAGLVLLHPFLQPFFETLGLLNAEMSFRSRGARTRAIHLLHYLATGSPGSEEHELLLEKVICGMPVRDSLEKELELSDEELAESEALLTAVIEHWGKLGRTSPAGLRESFLHRDGRLVLADNRWEITVERRGIDVLLAALPWSLYRIRLPWMPVGLDVDWA